MKPAQSPKSTTGAPKNPPKAPSVRPSLDVPPSHAASEHQLEQEQDREVPPAPRAARPRPLPPSTRKAANRPRAAALSVPSLGSRWTLSLNCPQGDEADPSHDDDGQVIVPEMGDDGPTGGEDDRSNGDCVAPAAGGRRRCRLRRQGRQVRRSAHDGPSVGRSSINVSDTN